MMVIFMAIVNKIRFCSVQITLFFSGLINSKLIRVNGESMEPTFADKSWIFCNAYRYKMKPISRWDTVLAYVPSLKKMVVKRIVGLPNEVVELKSGNLLINGVTLSDRNYEVSPVEARHWRLGSGEFILLGDNWRVSNDSRYFGSVQRHNIKGFVAKLTFSEVHIMNC